MSLTSLNRVDLSVLGLAILDDDGVVQWANAAWRNLAATGATLCARGGNQLTHARAAAVSGDEYAQNFAAALGAVLGRERDDFEVDSLDRDSDDGERWLTLCALRTRDNGVAIVCSADLPDPQLPRMNRAASSSVSGAWEWQSVSGRVSCSAALLGTLGLEAEEAPGDIDGAMALIEETTRVRTRRAVAAAKLSGIFNSDVCVVVPSHRPRYFRVHGEAAEWEEDGRPSRLIGYAYDVTDLRAAEDRLAELARYSEVVADLGRSALANVGVSSLLDSTCSAAAAVLPRSAFRILTFNHGRTVVMSSCGLNADSDVSAHEDYARLAAERDSTEARADVESSEWGSGVAVSLRGEKMVLQALAPQPAAFAEAEVSFIRALGNVLTAALARLRNEEELEAARTEVFALVENSPDLIVRYDDQLRITYINPAAKRYTDLGLKEYVGHKLGEIAPLAEDRVNKWEAGLRRVLTLGVEQEFEGRGVISGRTFNVRCVPEFSPDGKIHHLLAVCRDVTDQRRDESEKRRLEQQLEQASRLSSLGRLAATIAHEFNNVLMAIQPFADLLQRRSGATDPMIERAATHIGQAVQRGRRITQEMLRYTRAVEPVREPVEVRDLLTYICSSMRLVVAESLHIELDLPQQPLYLHADRTQLEQVFTNLISNARDAVRGRGTLIIRATSPMAGESYPFGVIPHVEQFVHLTFRDDGTGIAPEVMEHIFEPLFTSKRGGTGVGLAVAHQVVSAHGGHLFVESQEGVGTAFHIFLPRAHSVPGAESATTARNDVSLMRIVLVEDEPAIAEGLLAVLRSEGFEVAHADTGAAALPLIESFKPEIVLLDIGLPDMDGVDLYQRIHGRWPELPVIFSTGHGDRRKVEEVANQRTVGFLMKPYEVEELFAAISEVESRVATAER